ncbi:hypothetical protein JOB18_017137 [Solea senegalensis]|uniref:Uncharacterized protein n=1 Tax=Solea senegalensis TaxID=28829 RepID=A0AAV6QP49_SOLSE|nr:hypothetical protein JOB18_017137 [Solea senegalensis]
MAAILWQHVILPSGPQSNNHVFTTKDKLSETLNVWNNMIQERTCEHSFIQFVHQNFRCVSAADWCRSSRGRDSEATGVRSCSDVHVHEDSARTLTVVYLHHCASRGKTGLKQPRLCSLKVKRL